MDHNQVPYPYSLVTVAIGFTVGIGNSILVLAESSSLLSMENILQSIVVTLICTLTAFLGNMFLKKIQANWYTWSDKYFHLIWRRKKE